MIYNEIPSREELAKLLSDIKQKIKNESNLLGAIKNGTITIKEISDIYHKSFSNMNKTSLSLLHYPTNYLIKTITKIDSIFNLCPFAPFRCAAKSYPLNSYISPITLLTGDSNYSDELGQKITKDLPFGVRGISLIPHHGSKNNIVSYAKYFKSFDYHVVSSGLNRKYPNIEVYDYLNNTSILISNEKTLLEYKIE